MNSTGKDRAGFDPDVAKWGVWAVLRAFRTAVVKWSFVLLFGATSLIAAPPANFSVEDVLTGINQPITLKFLPDGRFLLLQKQGKISIVDVSGVVTQSETYMDLSSSAHADGLNFDQERGVLDIAIDPNFLAEPYIYVFYTPATGPNGARSRVSRFTHMQIAGGTSSRGNLGSELILWEDTQGYDSCCHFGGGIDFGPDGNIWLSTGDHFQGSYASSLEHAGGKIHRFTPTGEIPADNPLVDGAGPMVDSIFAYGLRNPFRSRWDLASGRYFIAEVGGNTQSIAWEDLHVIDYDYGSARFIDGDFGTAQDNLVYDAINFGWPTVEGLPPYDDFPGWTITNVVGDPLFGYPHDGNTTAITGGVVYHGDMFPPEFEGAYFYADSTRDFIRYIKFNPDGSVAPNPNPDPIDIQNPDSTSYPFDLEPLGRITSFDIGPDGALYYVSFTDSGGAYGEPNPAILGGVRRYIYDDGNARPVVVTYSPDVTSGPSPLDVNFTVEATDADGDAMSYFIEFGDGNFSPYLPLPAGTPVVVSHIYADDGLYTPILRVSDATRTTQVETTVSVGTAPVITSLTATNSRTGPNSSTFRFGDTITFQAEATDAEDGMLTGANFSWSVSFIRPGNVHPSLGPVDGTESVDFPIPDQGQGFSGPVYYRCFLTVTDSSGLVTTSSYDIFPEKSNISFDTVPAGITVQVNGNTAEPAPYVLDTLINYDHVITVPDTVCISGVEYGFVDWSNGVSTAQQVYNVPVEDSALTANYIAIGACGQVPEDGLVMHLRAGAGVVVDGSGVVAWEDQTDSPNVLTAIGSPTYVDGAGWSEGYVHFDGVDDAVMQSGFWGLPVGNADRTVLMVVRYNGLNAAGSGWVGFSYGNPTTNHAFGLTLTPTGNLGVQAWGSNDAAAYPEVDGVGQWLAHAAVFQSGVLTQYLNGAEIGTANRTYGTGSGEIRIAEELGGGKNLDMDVAEVLVYDRALDASELELAQSYFEAFHEIGSGGPTNSDPVVAITAPADGSSIGSNSLPLNLSGSATDAEDGDLGSSIMWTSSIDGALGSGATIAANLSVGSHTITATVTDSASAVGSATIALTVTDEGGTNGRPVVTILSPANGATFSDSGVAINFWASAADAEDGDLSAAISWTSDIDGPLGTGETIQTALSSGTHTITASVADSSAATSTDTVTITVWAGGLPPLTTSGLVVHLESDLNVSLQSGSSVAAWLDQSGMGNDLEAGGDPQLISDGSPSGLPVIRFDGVSDKLERINFQAPLGGLPTGNANRTMFVVASYTSSTWWSGVAYGTGSNNKAFGLAVTYPGGDLVLQGWGGGNDLVSTTPGIGAGWLVHSAVLENGVATMFKDGASIAQFSHTFQTALSRLTLGKEISDFGYVGMDVAAVLIYDRALSAAERASVEDYLQAKYLQAPVGN